MSQSIVTKIIRSFALVEFNHYGELYSGSIHIAEFTKLGFGYIPNLQNVINIGDEYKTVLKSYSEKHQSWKLEIIIDDDDNI